MNQESFAEWNSRMNPELFDQWQNWYNRTRSFDLAQIEQLTSLLSVGLTSPEYGFRTYSLARGLGVYTRDIEIWISRFLAQQEALIAVGAKCPCLIFEGPYNLAPIPIDIAALVTPSFLFGDTPIQQHLTDHLSARFSGSYSRLESFDYRDVRQFFMEGLWRFLFTRLGGSSSKTPRHKVLLQFTVITRTHGLRVNYSSPFWLSYSVFGSPTSPLTEFIEPGDWIFEVEFPNGQRAPDSVVYKVPPKLKADLSVIA